MLAVNETDILTRVTKYNLIRADRMLYIDIHEAVVGKLAGKFVAVPNLSQHYCQTGVSGHPAIRKNRHWKTAWSKSRMLRWKTCSRNASNRFRLIKKNKLRMKPRHSHRAGGPVVAMLGSLPPLRALSSYCLEFSRAMDRSCPHPVYFIPQHLSRILVSRRQAERGSYLPGFFPSAAFDPAQSDLVQSAHVDYRRIVYQSGSSPCPVVEPAAVPGVCLYLPGISASQKAPLS